MRSVIMEGTRMTTRGTALIALGLLLLVTAGTAAAAPLTGRLERALAEPGRGPADRAAVWVAFTDRGLDGAELAAALAAAEADLAPAARERRRQAGAGVDVNDLPLNPDYLDAVAATGADLRRRSRWLNAASVKATPEQIRAIAALPFVRSVDLVGGAGGERPLPVDQAPPDLQAVLDRLAADKSPTLRTYGGMLPSFEQVNLPAVHAMGLTGRGVTVAVLDTGFELSHECFAHLDVVAAHDFVDDDDEVGWVPGDNDYQTLYGTASLSVLAGYSPGNIVGSAWGVSVILAKTEDLDSETPAEEDAWIAAVEWAEGLGADIVNSGIGYYDWYDFADMDGRTAAISVAAEMAAARGVCVVNSVGNERTTAWGGVIAPADAAAVIAVGAGDLNDQVMFMSSPGPTADGRIKPDLLAPGESLMAASAFRDDGYAYFAGSNSATPVVSGIVALMLEQNPTLSPARVLADLKAAGSRSATPDNDYGWGFPDALAAVHGRVPLIAHEPLKDRESFIGGYAVEAVVASAAPIDPARCRVAWRVDGGAWRLADMADQGDGAWRGTIPGQGHGRTVDYYISIGTLDGDASSHPATAPAAWHSFRTGQDTTPPVIEHLPLGLQVPRHWPPVVQATITDNVGVASADLFFIVNGTISYGPYPLARQGDDFELAFPLPEAVAQPGVTVTYTIAARDEAVAPNMTSIGPYTFAIAADKGRILLVDDRSQFKDAPDTGRAPAGGAPVQDKSALDLQMWIIQAGFACDIIAADAVSRGAFSGYDAVLVSSGGNYSPLAYSELRNTMVAWSEQGGRLLVTGGETAYAAAIMPRYPELLPILHIVDYAGESVGVLRTPDESRDHVILNRPHRLPDLVTVDTMNGQDYSATDIVLARDEAVVAMRVDAGTMFGGLVLYDDNTNPESVQTVYLPVDLLRIENGDGPLLLDNVLSCLTAVEGPGGGAVAGRVKLIDGAPAGGVTIDAGRGRTTVTGADGVFLLDGLWGGDYTVTASVDGYAPRSVPVAVVDDATTGNVAFFLPPVTAVTASAEPGAAIPDNNPEGVASTVLALEAGTVAGISVDVDISHFAVGNLVVTLTSPSGRSVTLHNRTGGTLDDIVGNYPDERFVDGPGSLDDFLGEPALGPWTLSVADHQFGAVGTFNAWGVNLLVQPAGAAGTDDASLPAATRLVGNSPNPFNPRTTIAFDLARPGPVRLDIYDLRGRLVRRLVDAALPAGRHEAAWDGRDDQGGAAASGLYFCRLHSSGGASVHKMALVR